MVSKIFKYLAKLSVKDRKRFLDKVSQIEKLGLTAPGIKSVVSEPGVYRFRIGKIIRVKFRLENGEVIIIDADNRDRIYR